MPGEAVADGGEAVGGVYGREKRGELAEAQVMSEFERCWSWRLGTGTVRALDRVRES